MMAAVRQNSCLFTGSRISLTPDTLLLRPHRCDNCTSASLMSHGAYCDSTCFEEHPSSLDSASGSSTSDGSVDVPRHYPSGGVPGIGDDWGCTICFKYREAVGFSSSLGIEQSSRCESIYDGSIEPRSKSTTSLRPLIASSPRWDPGTRLSPVSRDDWNAHGIDYASYWTQAIQTKTQSSLCESCSTPSLPSPDQEDFILYGEPQDIERELSEEEVMTFENREDSASISEDDSFCYCGCCSPFITSDGSEQRESWWTEEGVEEEVAEAA
ncbi:unnamed protein product [Fusarium langsethiae]|nr:unnamed protein product [Fusarium langsethiae]